MLSSKKNHNNYSFKNHYLLNEAFTVTSSDRNFNCNFLEKFGDILINYFMSKQLYLETATVQKYMKVNDLHKVRSIFTSNVWLAYLFC